MALSFETSRLSASEILGDIDAPELMGMLAQVPAILSSVVVENLPPYFHRIKSEADAKVWFERTLSESRLLVVKLIGEGTIIGFVFVSVTNSRDAQIGYLLGEQYWGKGLATELLRGFIRQVGQTESWLKLIGGVDRSNHSSAKLLQKLGFIEQSGSDSEVIFYEYTLTS